MAITQDTRLMQLTTPVGKDALLIKRLRADEGISQLFRYRLEIVQDIQGGSYSLVQPASVLGKPMGIRLCGSDMPDAPERFFNGICVEFTQGGIVGDFQTYAAVVVPAAWYLTQTVRSRIFQRISVPEILRRVFGDMQVKYELQGNYEPRNYCVQYGESDWDFASRLMEEEGIFYFFEHSSGGHVMVVANSDRSHRDCPTFAALPFESDYSAIPNYESGVVYSWTIDSRLQPGKYTAWDHNFQLPTQELEGSQKSIFNVGQNQTMEVYEFPGEYAKRFDGVNAGGSEQAAELQKIFADRERTTKIRQQEIDAGFRSAVAASTAHSLTAGYKFTLTTLPAIEPNASHIIVSLHVEATQSPSYETDDPVPDSFIATLACIPIGGKSTVAPYRPPRKTLKPKIYGSQTALVVGPSGQEIFTDKFGRVKVRFYWDREGRNTTDTSCWVRVATSWAGKQWGAIQIPRVGMEVVVNFMNGDPDQPIIVGAVYNPNTMPPYALPDEKTKSTLKSLSTPGGGGFNEFRFEDLKGKEQIFVHAQRDCDTQVLNDSRESIGNDRHLTVERDQLESVKRDKHLRVRGNRSEKIGGQASLATGMSYDIKTSTKLAAEAGTEMHLKAGLTAVIEAGTSLTLKVGGNYININPGGVFINGAMVMINSGGAAGSGSGANPETPKDAIPANTATAGEKITAPTAASAPPPPPPPAFEALAAAARATPEPDAASPPAQPPVGQVEAAIAEAVAANPNVEAPVEQPISAAVDEAREAIAQYSEPELQQAVNRAREAAAPVVARAEQLAAQAENAAGDAAGAARAAAAEGRQAAEQANERIRQAAAAYEAERQKVDQGKQLVAAYESVIQGVGPQAMSLLKAADNASPFAGI